MEGGEDGSILFRMDAVFRQKEGQLAGKECPRTSSELWGDDELAKGGWRGWEGALEEHEKRRVVRDNRLAARDGREDDVSRQLSYGLSHGSDPIWPRCVPPRTRSLNKNKGLYPSAPKLRSQNEANFAASGSFVPLSAIRVTLKRS